MYMNYYKYPRTLHLPWSPGYSDDDIAMDHCDSFTGKEVVITEKLDGENTTMYRDNIHARSVDSRQHPSRNWVKRLHGEIRNLIPEGWRLCGENVYAQHSIIYNNLISYFYLFSIWDDNNRCLNWQQTLEQANQWGLATPHVLYLGEWNEKLVRDLKINTLQSEGYVVRLAASFHYDEFSQAVAKWVRAGHVTSDEHWMHKPIIPNKLAPSTLMDSSERA